ncbi:MAG: OmpA family protein [Microscillaceae bacterium]|nr:OmpA family protein [Microscillaceae bacterium]
MMKYLFLFILLYTLLGFGELQAQNYTSKSKKAIKLYEKAQQYLRLRQFDEGVSYLLKAVKTDKNFAEAHYKIATLFSLDYKTNQIANPGLANEYYQKSIEYFRYAIAAAPEDPRFSAAYLDLANYYMDKGDYTNAKKSAEKFLSFKPEDKYLAASKKIITDCEFAQEAIKKPLDFKSQPLPYPINQTNLQYFPALTGDQKTLVFTVRKINPESRREEESIQQSNFQNGAWSNPVSISDNINAFQNAGTASISADGRTLVFTICDTEPDTRWICDLFISYKEGNNWSEPKNLGPNVNSSSWESQPSLSADGRTLYFISARSGGKGGRDIWFSRRDDAGNWSPAQNLFEVNTTFEEVSPFIHPNNKTLFFASTGYPGMGGFDLYMCDYINKQWTKPENLGFPVNTFKDQVALFISADGKKGYYSVEDSRNNEINSSILHQFDMPEAIQPKVKSNYVKGYVFDSQSKQKLDAQIDLFDLTDNVRQASVESDSQSGNYLIVLNQGSEYGLEVHRKGYAFKSLSFNYTEGKDVEPLEINISLDPIAQGTVFRLNNIFFDYNKYELQEKSKTELDELVKFMIENSDVKGEISGHTDNVGSDVANKELSFNRAKSVYDYLVKAGIDPARLKYQGYGASKPQGDNNTEEGRAKNRRIEFEIL